MTSHISLYFKFEMCQKMLWADLVTILHAQIARTSVFTEPFQFGRPKHNVCRFIFNTHGVKNIVIKKMKNNKGRLVMSDINYTLLASHRYQLMSCRSPI